MIKLLLLHYISLYFVFNWKPSLQELSSWVFNSQRTDLAKDRFVQLPLR